MAKIRKVSPEIEKDIKQIITGALYGRHGVFAHESIPKEKLEEVFDCPIENIRFFGDGYKLEDISVERGNADNKAMARNTIMSGPIPPGETLFHVRYPGKCVWILNQL